MLGCEGCDDEENSEDSYIQTSLQGKDTLQPGDRGVTEAVILGA